MDPKAPTTYRGLPPSLRTPSFGLPGAGAPHRYAPVAGAGGSDEPLVLELGARELRMGLANEPVPRCRLGWHDALWRRAGVRLSSATPPAPAAPLRRPVWDLGYALRYCPGGDAGADGEDLIAYLGLVEDMVERGIRLAFTKSRPPPPPPLLPRPLPSG